RTLRGGSSAAARHDRTRWRSSSPTARAPATPRRPGCGSPRPRASTFTPAAEASSATPQSATHRPSTTTCAPATSLPPTREPTTPMPSRRSPMHIDEEVLPARARGCSVLGAGGGGDVHTGLLACQQAVQTHGPVPVVDLDELPDDHMIMPCGYIGAPTVSIEKLGSS